MIQVADNFNYRGKKPNFDRDSFDTLQDMKNYSENSLDDGHISYCKETDKHYKFNSNNQSDPTTGKWVEQHEAVPADEEDITEQNGTLQLANKTYDKQSFSGLGRVYLRKNIVGDKNVLTQAMINKANTIYVIQYDYDLKEANINIPENCVLQFDGGSLSNGTIVGNNTKIKTELEKIFNNITIDGNWNVVEAHPEWFGALPDGIYDCTDAIQKTINSFDVTKLNNGVYFINGTIQLRSHVVIFGEKGKTTIKSPVTKEFDVNDLPDANTLPYVFYSEKAVKVLFKGISFMLGDYYNGIGFKQTVNGNTDEWDAKIYIDNCHFEHGYRAVSIERTYRECRIIDSISYYACGDYAFFMEGTDNSIHNSTVGSCQQGGIYLSQNSRISNCKVFIANKAWRYKYDDVTPRSKYAVYISGSYCNVTGLDIQQNCANGIYIEGHDNYVQAILNANGYQRDKQSSVLCANAVLKCSNSILLFTSTTGFLNSYVSHYLYSTYNILSKYSLLYLDNKLYILSDVYDTGNDSFLNIKYLFDSISYTLDIYIKVPTKYGKLIVRDTKWANLNTYQWYSKNTDPYPSEAVDAEFISSNVLTLPNTLIGTKTYDKFGNELTWSKSDWLNPDGSLVTKVIFASKLNDFTKNNTIYNIVRYIDLKGETLTIPENSVLNFIGGAIGNGTIIGNKTKVINLNVDRIILSGTWFDSGITSNRLTNVLVGFQYFDTTVNKPIFWDGSKWIDATGATV